MENNVAAPVRRNFGKYLLFAFVISWIIFIAGCVLALVGYPALFKPISAIGMFGPLIAVLLTQGGLSTAKTGIEWKPKFRGCIGWWIVAWAGAPILCILGSMLYYALFPARYDPTCMSYLTAALGSAEKAAEQSALLTPATIYFSGMVSALTVGIANAIFALGEEVGWRGYMYPWLKNRMGKTRGRIVGGLIWGTWHWPLMALVGYEYNWSFFTTPWYLVLLGLVAFCVFTTAAGTLLDVLYEKTNCIWVPALAHGILNGSASIGVAMLVVEYSDQMILGPLPVGLISGIPMLVLAVIALVVGAKKAKA